MRRLASGAIVEISIRRQLTDPVNRIVARRKR